MPEFAYPLAAVDPATPHLAPRPEGGWQYENALTRVTARIADGWLSTPLPRPSFAALELATALRLPADFRPRWEAANAAPTAAALDQGAPRLAPDQGEAWWRYMTGKGALRLAWPTMDVAILDLLLLRERATGRVVRVLVWPERCSALVIPAAADYLVVRGDPLRPRDPQPPALVPREQALALLGDRVQPFPAPVPHWLYRGGDAHPFRMRSLRQQPGRAAGEFSAVRPDQVVDG